MILEGATRKGTTLCDAAFCDRVPTLLYVSTDDDRVAKKEITPTDLTDIG